jgi:hypothetical protein
LWFGIRGSEKTTSANAAFEPTLASWQSFKQRGWAVHFIDLTSLYLRLKIGAGRAVQARLVDSERAASTFFLKVNFLACCFRKIAGALGTSFSRLRPINSIHLFLKMDI